MDILRDILLWSTSTSWSATDIFLDMRLFLKSPSSSGMPDMIRERARSLSTSLTSLSFDIRDMRLDALRSRSLLLLAFGRPAGN